MLREDAVTIIHDLSFPFFFFVLYRYDLIKLFCIFTIEHITFYLQYTFLSDCFDRIAEEAKWDDPGE